MRRRITMATALVAIAALPALASAVAQARRMTLPPGSSLVSVGPTGTSGDKSSYGSSISDDGRYVAFESVATNLVPTPTHGPNVFLRDTVTGTTTLVSHNLAGVQADAGSRRPDISGNGRWIAFESHAHDLVATDPCTTAMCSCMTPDGHDLRRVPQLRRWSGQPGQRHPRQRHHHARAVRGLRVDCLEPGEGRYVRRTQRHLRVQHEDAPHRSHRE